MFGDPWKIQSLRKENGCAEGASNAQQLVGTAVAVIVASYWSRWNDVDESIANQAQVAMAEPTLRAQLQETHLKQVDPLSKNQQNSAKKPYTPGQSFISDLVLDVYNAYGAITEIKGVAQALCEYMLHPKTEELNCYFARELLQAHLVKMGCCDKLTQDSTALAEHLARLRKPGAALRLDYADQQLLSEIKRLTSQPKLWLAVLDNVLNCEKMGTKGELLLQVLAQTLPFVENDTTVAQELELLASSDKGHVFKQLRGEDIGELEFPPVDGPGLNSNEIL